MSWRPPDGSPPDNRRLERYRRRAGRVHRGSGGAGLIFVEPEVRWTQVGGALWWRRWSAPHYAAHLWMALPWLGVSVTDTIVDARFLEAELADWDAGRFALHCESLAVEWLSLEESRELARIEFGL
ncbi:hypothetical protein [Amycolatopsis granulosa]|uniref:hypothetical protein n=1 Tax=Amycolatopsis granulosa TaxID=185684 RepID=UPI00142346EA|nr:hypothetical protein [Amycolatopsis granulosa]NIH86595.1 hypothetical protein [Amycolatopsis granulosa]